ncbi:hypothetical protein [Labrys sp. ZIDIC5]|uniref:hypothetical protein n=1 Tax=Labrys sedimenti TaxID=3106036 RepID=UPI002ACA67B3|nr:hypothetical protein [Labrys sp. ZIDIC5]MDZ5448957.1 hypothetical protein [Labrys sp. ZIDIC5]
MKRTLLVALCALWSTASFAANPISADVDTALTKAAKSLGYRTKFRADNCQKDENFVCDVYVDTPTKKNVFKFMAVFPAPNEELSHFTVVLGNDTASTAYGTTSLSTIETLLSGQKVKVSQTSKPISDAIAKATASGIAEELSVAGVRHSVTVRGGAALIQVGGR